MVQESIEIQDTYCVGFFHQKFQSSMGILGRIRSNSIRLLQIKGIP